MRIADKNGFTLVEVMVGAALLAVLMMGLFTQQVEQSKARGAINLQMQSRQAVSEAASSVSANPGAFPDMLDPGGSGNHAVYVACLTDDGSPVPNLTFNSTSYATVFLPMTGGNSILTPVTGPALCNQNNPGIEVHVGHTSTENQFEIVALILPYSGANMGLRHYVAASRVAQMNLSVGFPSPTPTPPPPPGAQPPPPVIQCHSVCTSGLLVFCYSTC